MGAILKGALVKLQVPHKKHGRSKGTIKSPYGTKNIEADPDREIKLYPLKRLFINHKKRYYL